MSDPTSNTGIDEIELILDRLAVRMYDEGQLDKPSLMGRQVAIANINEAKQAIEAEIARQVALAKLEGFRVAFDSHDYAGLREYKANLESQLQNDSKEQNNE